MILHGYWRSTASYRVRIALNLKAVPYQSIPHDLRQNAQRDAAYLALNPQGLVPALHTGTTLLTQSLAILEWLEETIPTPPLLPATPTARATVRAMMSLIAADIHPLHNLRVLQTLRTQFHADQNQITAWIAAFIGQGLSALEALASRQAGVFCFGDTPTLADCLLVPQLYAARRFEVDLAPFPRLTAADSACGELEAFQRAHPSVQADADK